MNAAKPHLSNIKPWLAYSAIILVYLLQSSINLSAQSFRSNTQRVRISEIPRPTAPAELHITDLMFSDAMGDRNDLLDADERVEVRFTLENKGRGDAYRTRLSTQSRHSIAGVNYNATQDLGDLKAGQSRQVTLSVSGSRGIQTGEAWLVLTVREANGFDSDPAEVRFNTAAFRNPQLSLVDAVFTNNDGEGKITLGKMVTMEALIQNRGQGTARNVRVMLTCPPQVFPAGESEFALGELAPNESRRIAYEFFANKQYSGTDIAIEIQATESLGTYGLKQTQRVSLEKTLAKTQTLQVAGQQAKSVAITDQALRSDVDRNIPTIEPTYPNRYALVIGNEDYSKFQKGLASESNVAFARNDAQVVRDYLQRTMGVPAEQIDLKLDATGGEMEQAMERLKNLIQYTQGEAEVFVYYAGHGLPDEGGESYLIPVDVSGANVRMGVRLADWYQKLCEFPSKRVTVFLDACFSGGARGTELLAMARGVKIVPRANSLPGNLLVFTATSGEQSALPWAAQSHGMFTYHLLKFWQERRGDGSYGELAERLTRQVGLESVRTNNTKQDPQVLYSDRIADAWTMWKFR